MEDLERCLRLNIFLGDLENLSRISQETIWKSTGYSLDKNSITGEDNVKAILIC